MFQLLAPMQVLVLERVLEPHPPVARAQDAEQAGVGPMRSWATPACARVHVDHRAAYRSRWWMAARRVLRQNEHPIDSE
jgi:hypothetical protein